ncbi:hypothetical protein [Hydrogenophaga sp.]|uniref:hypothetical protein n=1 Tax=Hydrogenophaga sp. TaxID=1904254 RepID=UPI002FC6AF94
MSTTIFQHPVPRLSRTLALSGLCALALTGCAGDQDWARAMYQGHQLGARQCQLATRPGAAPCPTLSPHDAYEQERQRLRPASGAVP